jgi:GNAT superfamily N-acetyltransferase
VLKYIPGLPWQELFCLSDKKKMASLNYKVKKVSSLEEMLPHFPLIKQLSPKLGKKTYKELLELMIPHNYFQAAIYDQGKCVAVSGYWICAKLYSGKYIEIDNFVVDENYRSKGLGKILLGWLLKEGKKEGCQTAMLDAYAENTGAHRFYYREGFYIRGFHYLKSL